MGDLLADLIPSVTNLVRSYGYVGLLVLMAMGDMFLPIPTQLILPLSGFLASQGQLALFPAMVAATTGSVIGALIIYGVGRQLGDKSLRKLIGRFGRYVLVRESDFDKARSYFEQRGRTAVLVGRIIPGTSSFISVPAGVARMPLGRYTIYTAAGCAVWNVAHIGLGWILGTQWRLIREYAPVFEYVMLAALGAIVIWFFWRRWRKYRR
jgi:membrane protein DedA with SNARE-associated domain